MDRYLQLKKEGFQFKGYSYLFWEYVRILKSIQKYNPNVFFLLENVYMSDKWEKVITDAIGVKPILINSTLVSAQNRKRYYWTNIPNVTQPKNKNIHLKDILDDLPLSTGVIPPVEDLKSSKVVGRRLNKHGKREDANRDLPDSFKLINSINLHKENAINADSK